MTGGIAVNGKDVNSEGNDENQYDRYNMVTEDEDKKLISANDVAKKGLYSLKVISFLYNY